MEGESEGTAARGCKAGGKVRVETAVPSEGSQLSGTREDACVRNLRMAALAGGGTCCDPLLLNKPTQALQARSAPLPHIELLCILRRSNNSH